MRAWCSVCLAVASACAAQVPMPQAPKPGPPVAPAARTPLEFRFDGGFGASPGLRFSFTRGVETVDPLGDRVGADEPRFDAERSIMGATSEEIVRASVWNTKLLGSGLGADGVTPIMVLFEASSQNLDVFTVADGALMLAEAGGPGRNRTVCEGQDARPDIFRGAYPDRAYAPAAGVVCHGLIVLACTVSVLEGGEWIVGAVALVVSQDEGATWALAYEDAPAQPGVERLREWAMQNYWTFDRGVAPLEAYFVAADYRSKPETTGGRVVMVRARRTAAGMPWVVEPGATVYSTEGPAGQHVHTAAVAPYGAGGLRVVVAIGDNSTLNRVVSLTRMDDDYGEVAGWAVDESYHGWAGDPGGFGNQFIGCAPLEDPRRLLVGSDLTTEQLLELDTSGGGHPAQRGVYGWGMAEGLSSQNFIIRTPTPELAGPYISKFEPQVSGIADELSYRLLYSPDGRRWATVYAPGGKSGWSACLHGGHAYIDGAANIQGVRRVAIPPMRSARPLVVGPGTLQRLRAQPTLVANANGQVTPLSRDGEGRWVDGGVPLQPQPPAAGQVYRIETTEAEPGLQVVDLLPLAGAKDFGQALGTGYFGARLWVMNASESEGSRPVLQLRSDSANLGFDRVAAAIVTDSWQPILMAGQTPPLAGENLRLKVRAGTSVGVTQSFYLALDAFGEGVDSPGWPVPPDPTGAGVRYPDELALIDGFSCGEAWTITLACQIPFEGWDRYKTGLLTRQHLATLRGDPGDYIWVFVDLFQERVVLYVFEDGEYKGAMRSLRRFPHRGSPVLVSIARGGQGGAISATISFGGSGAEVAETYSGQPVVGAIRPREILMGDETGASGDGVISRVSPMLWWGGRIDTARALSDVERRSLLGSLEFLGPDGGEKAGRRGDFDGDGDVDFADAMAWHELRARGDGRADVTGDGVVDERDLYEIFAALDR